MNTLALLLTAALCCWRCGRVMASAGIHTVSHKGVMYAAAPQERGAYSVGPAGGRYNYGYNTGDGIAKVEVRQHDGSIVGSYRYFDPTGKQVVRSYVADNRGFRVLGNDLPISPDTPASKVLGAPAFTAAVEGTREFAIPPPLGASTLSQTSSYQLQQQQSQQQQLQDQLVKRQQEAFRLQQQQLEEQRRQLRLQEEKLEALQRELDARHLRIQQQLQQSQVSVHQQQLPVQQYQFQSHQQQSQLPQIQNQLTGGLTSPYFYFQHDINYDFPAGFAYAGLPVINTSPSRKTVYPKSTYTIGQA
nr:histone-lysine N-methyltransferase 2D-like [Cherax quadricarinatus]